MNQFLRAHLHRLGWVVGYFFTTLIVHAVALDYYLPANTSYDPTVPTPKSSLGYEVGEWHVRHDQLVAYLKLLAEKSARIDLEVIGHTYEQRELLLLTITSPSNRARLEGIREQHVQLSQPRAEAPPVEDMPVVLYMGYSVHGDESSGANAALLAAYHLAAATGPEIQELLHRAVILLDPCLNPDGFNRFAQWANSHRGKHPVGDENHREHWAVWPAGRGNHYWFDLNRDWLLLQHPESRARIRKFHRWKPNVHTDFHEMGSQSTFFFQPGVPERRNPLTPEANVRLTETIARYHAEALDEIGSLYYTEERFDDYYFGKGSTYPDINGGIGILFEQASSRGHLRQTDQGEFDFPFTIRNQFRTTLSTFRAAVEHRIALLRHQREFYEEAMEQGRKHDVAGYVFGDPQDQVKTWHFLEVLLMHRIEVHTLAEPISIAERTFAPGTSYVVPMHQPQYRLARTILERQTNFPDNIFYDVSGWTFPLAMNLSHAALQRIPRSALGPALDEAPFPEVEPPADQEPYAYAFAWHHHYAPRALYRLLEAGAPARVALRPLTTHVALGRGAIVIPMRRATPNREPITDILQEIAVEDGVQVHALSSGLTPEGIDLGSPKLRPVQKPVPLILVGQGISAYEAGEAWHLLDQRYDIKVTLMELDRLAGMDLRPYTHLILVHGNYATVSDASVAKIKRWVEQGGVLVALKGATQWAAKVELAHAEFKKEEDDETPDDVPEKNKNKDARGHDEPREGEDDEDDEAKPPERLNYGDFETLEDAKKLSGAFFEVDLDVSHPLGFGYPERALAVFRNSRIYMKPSKNPYGTVALYGDGNALSGYVHEEELAKLKGTASIISEKLGEGTVILMVDNPNFRAYTHGTAKLFLNALFFGSVIEQTKE